MSELLRFLYVVFSVAGVSRIVFVMPRLRGFERKKSHLVNAALFLMVSVIGCIQAVFFSIGYPVMNVGLIIVFMALAFAFSCLAVFGDGEEEVENHDDALLAQARSALGELEAINPLPAELQTACKQMRAMIETLETDAAARHAQATAKKVGLEKLVSDLDERFKTKQAEEDLVQELKQQA